MDFRDAVSGYRKLIRNSLPESFWPHRNETQPITRSGNFQSADCLLANSSWILSFQRGSPGRWLPAYRLDLSMGTIKPQLPYSDKS
jgi:hypothetical protein